MLTARNLDSNMDGLAEGEELGLVYLKVHHLGVL
ncbi:MAG: hypothetical protein ACI90V_013755 [Bacillariaceae sp.]|jgi:hypothetical protein